MMAKHTPVLCAETIGYIAPPGAAGIFVDATFGQAGHSQRLLDQVDSKARLLALDRDEAAFAGAQALAEKDARVIPKRGRFSDLATILPDLGLSQVQGAIMDLGLSSAQLEDPVRGFSYRADGPLDMRMDCRQRVTAATWLNQASAPEIAKVIRRYGQERYAGRISRAIVRARPLSTTKQLVRLISSSQPTRTPGKHGARRVFQAIRIFVNEELTELQAGLEGLFNALAVGGRLAVISFHSLEDRIVKHFFRDRSTPAKAPRHVPLRAEDCQAAAQVIAGPVRPSEAERMRNVRARSAVLRVLERVL